MRAEIELFPGIGDTPFAGLLADDQGPLRRGWQREQRIFPRGKSFAANQHIRVRNECRRFVRASAPHFSKGHQIAENFAAAHAGTGIAHGDRLAVGEFAGGGGRRTDNLRLGWELSKRRRNNKKSADQNTQFCSYFSFPSSRSPRDLWHGSMPPELVSSTTIHQLFRCNQERLLKFSARCI